MPSRFPIEAPRISFAHTFPLLLLLEVEVLVVAEPPPETVDELEVCVEVVLDDPVLVFAVPVDPPVEVWAVAVPFAGLLEPAAPAVFVEVEPEVDSAAVELLLVGVGVGAGVGVGVGEVGHDELDDVEVGVGVVVAAAPDCDEAPPPVELPPVADPDAEVVLAPFDVWAEEPAAVCVELGLAVVEPWLADPDADEVGDGVGHGVGVGVTVGVGVGVAA